MKRRGLAEWETLLEPGECECVTLLGQIISEIDTGSEKKTKSSRGNEKGKSCVRRDWVSSSTLEQSAEPQSCPAGWDAGHAAVPQAGSRRTRGLLANARAWGNRSHVAQVPALPCEASVVLRRSEL